MNPPGDLPSCCLVTRAQLPYLGSCGRLETVGEGQKDIFLVTYVAKGNINTQRVISNSDGPQYFLNYFSNA